MTTKAMTKKLDPALTMLMDKEMKLSRGEMLDLCLDQIQVQFETQREVAFERVEAARLAHEQASEAYRKEMHERAKKKALSLASLPARVHARVGDCQLGLTAAEAKLLDNDKAALLSSVEDDLQQARSLRHRRDNYHAPKDEAPLRAALDDWNEAARKRRPRSPKELVDKGHHYWTSGCDFPVSCTGTQGVVSYDVNIALSFSDVRDATALRKKRMKACVALLDVAYDAAKAYKQLKVFNKTNKKAKMALLRRLLDASPGGASALAALDKHAVSLAAAFSG